MRFDEYLEVQMPHDKKFRACHDRSRFRLSIHRRATRRAWKIACARFASA